MLLGPLNGSIGARANVTGVGATAQVGVASGSPAVEAVTSGIQGASQVGSVDIQLISNINVSLTGVTGTSALGSARVLRDNFVYVRKYNTVGTPRGLYFDPSGTRMYAGNGTLIEQYSLSIAWDISTASFVRNSNALNSTTTRGLFFRDNGTRMFVLTSAADRVEIYNLSTAWNVATASYVAYMNSADTSSYGLTFKPDGTRSYVLGDANNNITQFNWASAWGGTSPSGQVNATSTQSFSISGQIGSNPPYAVVFNSTGTRFYIASGPILSTNNNFVYEYQVSTPWDVSTASYVGVFLDTSGVTNTSVAMFLGNTIPGLNIDTDLYLAWSITSGGTPGVVQYSR